MPELIDRQALIRDMCNNKTDAKCPCYPNCYPCDFSEARRIIDTQPTIEAEPVRRGHWVLTRDEQYEYCHCSECGYDTGENWMIGSEIPYCSQCGSKNYDGGADNG